MNKDGILGEIRRTAAENGGVPLGSRRFAQVTDIRPADWQGELWARWGDALQEAGFAPNGLQGAYSTPHLLEKLARLSQQLGRIPTANDLRLKNRTDDSYPNAKVFERLGRKAEVVRQLLDYCQKHPKFGDIALLCQQYAPRPGTTAGESNLQFGYVYLLRHGTRRGYEIGVELPLRLDPIHVITTDDPAGVEVYWHRRFAEK